MDGRRSDGWMRAGSRTRGAALAHYLVATAALVGVVAVAGTVVSALGGHLGRFLRLLAMP